MNKLLPLGLTATVRIAASSANLGSGFDSLGVALSMYDEVSATVVEEGLAVEIEGEDADKVSRDGSHLVVQALRHGLKVRHYEAPGLALKCTNVIPHARGLGSSASAIVGGLALAQALTAKAVGDPQLVDRAELVQLGGEFEGHCDNVAASVLGGAIVSWSEVVAGDDTPRYHAVPISVLPQITPIVFIPQQRGFTHVARGVLPDLVPREDAVANLSRSAVMVVALSAEPRYLFAASADRLHQPYRAAENPETTALIERLRSHSIAAMVSGAGPTVLALTCTETERRQCLEMSLPPHWECQTLTWAPGVQVR